MTRSNVIRAFMAAGLVTVLSLFSASSAFAIYDHSVVEAEFTIGCDEYVGSEMEDIAIDEDDEVIYIFCDRGFGETPRGSIEKYDYEGNKVNFEASVPYIAGNEIVENPANPVGTWETGFSGGHMAVDNSGGPHDGTLYVFTGASGAFNGTENIATFAESGEFAGSIEEPEGFAAGNGRDMDVGPDGSVYFMTSTRISKYDSTYNEVARMYPVNSPVFIGGPPGNKMTVDSKGAFWVILEQPVKYEPDQMFTNFTKAFGSNEEKFAGKPSPYVPLPLDPSYGGGVHIAADPSGGRSDLYVNRGNGIDVFSEGTPTVPTYKNAPRFGQNVGGGTAITVDKTGRVFTSYFESGFGSEKKVIVFGPGNIIPDVFTQAADVENVGHEGAELTALVDLDEGSAVQSCQLEVGLSKGSYTETPVPCTPSAFGTDTTVSAEISGLETGTEYHYRFSATNEDGTNFGGDRVFTPAYVLNVKTLPATSIDESGATLQGQLNPDNKATDYYFEYGLTDSYGLETDEFNAGSGSSVITVGAPVEGLPAAKTFHYRIVASNEDGTTYGEDRTFRTASTPGIFGLRATDLTETSAILHATIDPVGYPTKYRFEYGPSTDYGQSIPVPDESIGSGNEPVEVEQNVTGLTPGITYHYRVVATNEPWGPSFSADTTFDFAPPSCPNDHARQETASTFLPDCRAYELVSPGEAGAVQLFPGKEAWDLYSNFQQDPLQEEGAFPLNNGLASSPPRLMFYGMLGVIDGLRGPNLLAPDSYLATRTSSGWVTTLPGFTDELEQPGLKQCSDSMHRCLEYNKTFTTEKIESQAYVHTAEGEFQERLPQNSNLVPGSNDYKGFRRVSPDFSNFVFSSNTTTGIFGEPYPGVAFTVDGQTIGAGSAYDNDLENRTVQLISRLPGTVGGGHIPQNGTSTRPIQFPAISGDGSHVLMLTEGGVPGPAGPPYRLYMRVNDSISYDVSKGTAEEFVGMTRDGSSVTFTSTEQLNGDDEDESVDLYRWEEETDSLTLVSAGNNAGNEDECGASWTAGCGIEVPNTERRWAWVSEIPNGNPGVPYFEGQGLDDLIAEQTGDVYFFSPESLDGAKPGISGQRNLYVARENGQIHLVGTLDAGTNVYRMTIARDGRFAAFLTNSRMTGYDNQGLRQVYLFDRDAGTIVCASCRPGAAPANSITVSQGGKFMSDAGQVFFDSKDSLVPRDKNGEITDTYEYVGGRPQLVSSGLAARDFTGGSELLGLFAKPEFTGLEAVSRDGTDVYFSTYSSLVDEDQNGQYIKFYDARTNGGFANPPVDAPCAAADECHGTDTSPPAPRVVSSGVPLGNTGNVQQPKKSKKSKKKQKAKKRKKARRRKAAKKRRAARKKLRHRRSQGGRANG